MKKPVKPLGLYIHIPFCKSKCIYCDFYSLPRAEDRMDRYVSALCRQLAEIAQRTTAHTVDSVYLGGGTPSYLGEKRLRHILKTVKKHYHLSRDAEITLEANPDSAGDWRTLRALRRAGVHIVQDRALSLARDGETLTGVAGERGWYPCRAVVVTTGGVSYPLTGSTGDGYALAEALGHTVIPPRGSLVPLESESPWCVQMQGLSLRNVGLTVWDQRGKKIFREQGELLFTHFGLSGPLALSASAHMDFTKGGYIASIDWKPALDDKKLDARLLREFAERSNQDCANALGALVPRSDIPVMVQWMGVSLHTKVHEIRKDQRMALLAALKGFAIPIKGPRPVEEAIITAGGVKLSELDPKTMQSKKVPGVFFAGEVLDADAYTGGFNLQIAWCTGRAAGEGAAHYCRGAEGL